MVFHASSENVSIKKVVFGEPKKDSKYKNVSIPIYYLDPDGNKKPFFLRMGDMKAPFGSTAYPPNAEVTPQSKLSVTMALESQSGDKYDNLRKFFKKFEEKLHKYMSKHPDLLGKESIDMDVLESRFNPMVRYAKDRETGEVTDKYPPNVKAKLITRDDGELVTRIWKDRHTRLTSHDVISPGTWLESFVEFSSIYVVQGNFGVTMKALQLLLKSVPTKEDYLFDDDSEDESD